MLLADGGGFLSEFGALWPDFGEGPYRAEPDGRIVTEQFSPDAFTHLRIVGEISAQQLRSLLGIIPPVPRTEEQRAHALFPEQERFGLDSSKEFQQRPWNRRMRLLVHESQRFRSGRGILVGEDGEFRPKRQAILAHSADAVPEPLAEGRLDVFPMRKNMPDQRHVWRHPRREADVRRPFGPDRLFGREHQIESAKQLQTAKRRLAPLLMVRAVADDRGREAGQVDLYFGPGLCEAPEILDGGLNLDLGIFVSVVLREQLHAEAEIGAMVSEKADNDGPQAGGQRRGEREDPGSQLRIVREIFRHDAEIAPGLGHLPT